MTPAVSGAPPVGALPAVPSACFGVGADKAPGDSANHYSKAGRGPDGSGCSGGIGEQKDREQAKESWNDPATPGATGGTREKYHDKLIVDLSGEQMAVMKDALLKARRESGLRDRASLIAYIARVFLEGAGDCENEAAASSRKPPYQIVLHNHPLTGIAEVRIGER